MVIRENEESGFWPVLMEELSCRLLRWQWFLYFSAHRLVEHACENRFSFFQIITLGLPSSLSVKTYWHVLFLKFTNLLCWYLRSNPCLLHLLHWQINSLPLHHLRRPYLSLGKHYSMFTNISFGINQDVFYVPLNGSATLPCYLICICLSLFIIV